MVLWGRFRMTHVQTIAVHGTECRLKSLQQLIVTSSLHKVTEIPELMRFDAVIE